MKKGRKAINKHNITGVSIVYLMIRNHIVY